MNFRHSFVTNLIYDTDMKMLIVDDNQPIVTLLKEVAQSQGFKVEVAYDGQQALDIFNHEQFDIILLDVMMPIIDGFEVCRIIRKESMVPIIMITARSEDFEKIMGLDIGADDYIVKPFSAQEVMARVRALLRRIEPIKQDTLKVDELTCHLPSFTCTYKDIPIKLTKKEFELLTNFMSHPNLVFTREQLLDNLWGYDFYGDSRTVNTHIKRLRHKLDQLEDFNYKIETIWGVGYKWSK